MTISYSKDKFERLRLENEQLGQKCQELERRVEALVAVQDLWDRARRNSNLSLANKIMYSALIETCPDLLKGMPVDVNVWNVREDAGWVSEGSVTRFFQDMVAIGAFTYDPGNYNKKEHERMGKITPNLEVLLYPEYFDTKALEKRRKAREDEKKKRDERQEAWRILQCEMCGSLDIRYGLYAECASCHHKYEPVENISPENISIKGVEIANPELDGGDYDTGRDNSVDSGLRDDDKRAYSDVRDLAMAGKGQTAAPSAKVLKPVAQFGAPAPRQCLSKPEHGFTRVFNGYTRMWEPCTICEEEFLKVGTI